ncbi:hypothetical protein QZH41_007617 [Actinostola sp. cb2023]|nr:hypothetical protein QZH41_007617 [Actinostola sp. cb2023]
MSRNKTPGSDGLPREFYLTFWDVLSADLVEVLNFPHSCGSLSTSQRRGFISLVPKKGDLRLRKNWRPITLLNVDYKIASRTISARLLRVLHLIVSPDQTGSVPGRFIGETVILLQNISDFATLRDIPTALISLDQEKAFDRVDWPFLFKTLQTMGFGPSFIHGTFRWDIKKDTILLREVRNKEPYIERIGSKESGQKWSEIAAAINTHADFAVMPRDQRSVRERFNKLVNDFNTKMRKEERASGISPDDLNEAEQILEEIKEITSNTTIACNSTDKAKSEIERAKALTIRNKAMTSWGKDAAEEDEEEVDIKIKTKRKRSRRSNEDPLEYLKIKRETEMELKKEEMSLKKEQLSMENKRLEAEQGRQMQMQEQFLLQQRQLQQQMQAQAQSQALILALLQKSMDKS